MSNIHYLPLFAGLLSAAAYGAEATAVDTSQWKCEFCPAYSGISGSATVGVGYLTDDALRVDRYDGLGEEGGYVAAGADLLYQDGARYYTLRGNATSGEGTYDIVAEGGRQGGLTARLDLSRYTRTGPLGAETPYRGVGGDDLTLPAGWTSALTTAGLTDLDGALRPLDMEQERSSSAIALRLAATPRLTYSAGFSRDRKQGLKANAGSFGFTTSMVLAEPVDYTTDTITAAAAYAGNGWGAKLTYEASFFRNENRALSWENAFTPFGGADEGRMALPPDNEFHQISLAGNYRFSKTLLGYATVAVGQARQNEDFLPYTVNDTLATGALPRDSLDGKVDTLNAAARLTGRPTEDLSLYATYRHNKRDNKTPQATYEYVVSDAFLGSDRTNRPYSFEESALEAGGVLRLTGTQRLSAEIEQVAQERTLSEVEKTTESRARLAWRGRPQETVETRLSLGYADRNGDDYVPVDSTVPAQNPLLRKFNLADRQRTSVGASIGFTPNDRFSADLGADFRLDDYDDSTLGLLESRATSYTLDFGYVPRDEVRLHGFLAHDRIDSTQAGSTSYSEPDWTADQLDTVNTVGVGAEWAVKPKKLDVGLEYTVSDAVGAVSIGGASDLPDLTTRVDTVRLYGKYVVRKNLSLLGSIRHETLRSRDWAVDDVDPETIPTVLGLGEDAADYDATWLALYLQFAF